MFFVKIINMKLLKPLFGAIVVLNLMSCGVWKTANLNIKKDSELKIQSYLIQNVNIIPMTSDTLLMNQSVLVTDGIISSIGANIPIGNEKIIDGNGLYLSPGLMDMHVHIWDQYELGLYLANGVTACRNMLGMPFHLKLKRKINSGRIIGPVLFSASPELTGFSDKSIEKKRVKTPEKAKKMVKRYKRKGYDYIKTYNRLPHPVFDAVIEQASASSIPIVAHPSFEVDYSYHFNPSIISIEHTEDIVQQGLNNELDSIKLESIVDLYVNSKKAHCPTLIVYYNLTDIYNREAQVLTSDDAYYINPFIRKVYKKDYDLHLMIKYQYPESFQHVNEQHKFHIYIVKRMHEAGVNLICGTDAGVLNTAPGFSLHQELAFYKEAGMSNFEALKTATVNPSKTFREYANMGTIEIGKKANLILTKTNPLQDIATFKNPGMVLVNGRLIDENLINEFKKRAYDRKNNTATWFRMLLYIMAGK